MNKLFRAFRNFPQRAEVAWNEDHSFRTSALQVLAGIVIATILTFYLHGNEYFWLLLVGSLFPILIVETINTAIEAVTDKASPERHPLAKKLKTLAVLRFY